MMYFIQSMKTLKVEENDIEMSDVEGNSIINVKKLEIYAPQLTADMLLANTSDGKLFIIGQSKDK